MVTSLLLLAGGWVGLRAWQTRGRLTTSAALAIDLGRQILSGDVDTARRTLAALQRQTSAARSGTADPGWWAARHTPYAGDDLTAVREVAVVVDDLARHALPPLLAVDPAVLAPAGGRFDLAAIRSAGPELTRAEHALRQAGGRLGRLRVGGLLPETRAAVDGLRADLARLAGLTTAARRAAALLPALLGADGPRDYLLLSQNLAEARATGGMFGAYAVIRAENGRVRIVSQGATGTRVNGFDKPVVRLDARMRALYGDLPAIYGADVNLTPHFPTAAALYREMFRRSTGRTVDGVFATDPVVLSHLLAKIGPVRVPGEPTLTAATAVRALLADAYRRTDGQRQDEYFAAASRAVFDAVVSRGVPPRDLVDVLTGAVEERRLLFWSARPEEQSLVSGTPLAGELPEREDVPTVGVFLNDGSGAKLGYYLTRAAELTVGPCRADGRHELLLRVTVGSTAPRTGLSEYVTGLALAGDPYTARTLVSVFSPAGGAVVRARLDGRPAPLGSGRERGRQVGLISVDVAPGRSHVLEVSLLGAVNPTGAARLWLTPGVTPWTTHVSPARSCDQ